MTLVVTIEIKVRDLQQAAEVERKIREALGTSVPGAQIRFDVFPDDVMAPPSARFAGR